MSATHVRCGIEDLVVRIQADFLTTPWLALRLPAAQERFNVDEITCEAVLDALDRGTRARTFTPGCLREALPGRAAASRDGGSQTHCASRGISRGIISPSRDPASGQDRIASVSLVLNFYISGNPRITSAGATPAARRARRLIASCRLASRWPVASIISGQ